VLSLDVQGQAAPAATTGVTAAPEPEIEEAEMEVDDDEGPIKVCEVQHGTCNTVQYSKIAVQHHSADDSTLLHAVVAPSEFALPVERLGVALDEAVSIHCGSLCRWSRQLLCVTVITSSAHSCTFLYHPDSLHHALVG
jgi:hypothetical protein